jgi:hypothetical protein
MLSVHPNHCFESILHITTDFLKHHNLRGLALDLDNTLVPYHQTRVMPAVAAWIAGLKQQGFGLAVLSNANEKRVASFCAPLGLPYISKAGKPGNRGYKMTAKLLKLEPKQIGMVGDQLFTDILGARRFGYFAIWVKPINLSNPLYRLRHMIEVPFIKKAPHGNAVK